MLALDENTDLGFLTGSALVQVGLGQNEIVLRFHPECSITIEGDYSVGAEQLETFVSALDGVAQLGLLIGGVVESYGISTQSDLELSFDNGGRLIAHNSSSTHECLQIVHKDRIWVV